MSWYPNPIYVLNTLLSLPKELMCFVNSASLIPSGKSNGFFKRIESGIVSSRRFSIDFTPILDRIFFI